MVKVIWFVIITMLVSAAALAGLITVVVKLIRKREE